MRFHWELMYTKWNGEIRLGCCKSGGRRFCNYPAAAIRGSSSGWLVEDPYFFQNIQGAKRAGIKVGVYFFTQAIDLVEAVEEASMVITLLGDTNWISLSLLILREQTAAERIIWTRRREPQ